MSRPKSEKTLALERDRAIRKERRLRKRIEREARRAARAEKKRLHDLCEKRPIKPVKNGNGHASLFDAVCYRPLKLEDCLIKKGEDT